MNTLPYQLDNPKNNFSYYNGEAIATTEQIGSEGSCVVMRLITAVIIVSGIKHST